MKLSKIFSVVMVTVMLLTAVSNVALAYDPSQIQPDTDNVSDITKLGGDILGVVQVVGSVVAVVILAVLGVKYMMGSASEKAEYKKTLMPYVIGAVLLFAATNIVGLVFGWAENFAK